MATFPLPLTPAAPAPALPGALAGAQPLPPLARAEGGPGSRPALRLVPAGGQLPLVLPSALPAVSPLLARTLLLALLLHVWLVLLLGNAPGGTAQPGQGVWGAVNVTLRGSETPGLVNTAAAPALSGPQGDATLPRWGGTVREQTPALPPTPGAAQLGVWSATPAPMAVEPAPPVPAGRVVEEQPAPPVPSSAGHAQPDAARPAAAAALPFAPLPVPAPAPPPLAAPDTALVPTLVRTEAPAPPMPAATEPAPVPVPVPMPMSAPVPTPVRVAEGTLSSTLSNRPATERMAQSLEATPRASVSRPQALPARLPELAAPLAPPSLPDPAPPAAAPPQAPAPAPEAPVRRLSSPLAPPAAAVAPLPVQPASTTAPLVAAPTLPTMPALSAMPAMSALPAAPTLPAMPAVAAPARLPVTPVAPATLGSPDAGQRVGQDLATPAAAAASAPPRLNLQLARPRGGPLSSFSAPGALPVLPRPPELSDKLGRDIQKAAKGDCRTAYRGAGVLAVVPLAVETARADSGCKW